MRRKWSDRGRKKRRQAAEIQVSEGADNTGPNGQKCPRCPFNAPNTHDAAIKSSNKLSLRVEGVFWCLSQISWNV